MLDKDGKYITTGGEWWFIAFCCAFFGVFFCGAMLHFVLTFAESVSPGILSDRWRQFIERESRVVEFQGYMEQFVRDAQDIEQGDRAGYYILAHHLEQRPRFFEMVDRPRLIARIRHAQGRRNTS